MKYAWLYLYVIGHTHVPYYLENGNQCVVSTTVFYGVKF